MPDNMSELNPSLLRFSRQFHVKTIILKIPINRVYIEEKKKHAEFSIVVIYYYHLAQSFGQRRS